MATISGNISEWYQSTLARCTIYVTYTVTNTDDETIVTTSSLEIGACEYGAGAISSEKARAKEALLNRINVGGIRFRLGDQSVAYKSSNMDFGNTYTFSGSKSVIKTHGAQTEYISLYNSYKGSLGFDRITVPARTSYTVTYNANSGIGQPANQTKWYDEDLTLAAAKPTKEGYTFKGWATSEAGAKAGTVSYAAGATYTGNAALTLYAVWELTYQKPTITNVSVERCTSAGVDDDEGGYAKVDFDWTVFQSDLARYYGGNTYPYAENTIYEAHVTVGTFTVSFTASTTLPIIVGDGSFSTDSQYDVEISIVDTQTVSADHSVTYEGILAKSFFPMDFNADGTALGIFMPAPDSTEGIYLGKNLFLPVDTTATTGTDKEIYDALVALGWNSDVIV